MYAITLFVCYFNSNSNICRNISTIVTNSNNNSVFTFNNSTKYFHIVSRFIYFTHLCRYSRKKTDQRQY